MGKGMLRTPLLDQNGTAPTNEDHFSVKFDNGNTQGEFGTAVPTPRPKSCELMPYIIILNFILLSDTSLRAASP